MSTTLPGEVEDLRRIADGDVEFERDGGAIEAYVARPSEGGDRGGIVVIHEAFGPTEHIRDIARRFANVGFDVVAPDLYGHVGRPVPDDTASLVDKMFRMRDADVVADLAACAAYLRSLPTSNGKVGCIGFCSGGRQALLFACSSDIDAVIDCWGGMIDRATPQALTTPERPVPVVDLVDRLTCPLFAVGGAEDENPSPSLLRDLERRLAATGKTAKVEIFEDAGHAFLADYRPSYRSDPAHLLWPQLVDFFSEHLT
jgi:carboxymethylenebutenolidase